MDTNFECYWGIDVSKNWLDIAINNQVFRIAQTEQSISDFIKDNRKSFSKILVVLESTGGYEKLATHCLSKSGLTVHVAHPNKVCAYAKARGRLSAAPAGRAGPIAGDCGARSVGSSRHGRGQRGPT